MSRCTMKAVLLSRNRMQYSFRMIKKRTPGFALDDIQGTQNINCSKGDNNHVRYSEFRQLVL